jgi:hypothetical protein
MSDELNAITPARLRSRREHFMQEIERSQSQSRRRHWAVASGVTAVAVVVATTVGLNLTGGPHGSGAAAFAVERQPASGAVTVKIVDSDVAAKQATKQLRAAGYSVTVETIPASPQLVGTWLSASTSNNQATTELSQQINQISDTIVIPANVVAAGVSLTFGRPTRHGEAAAAVGVVNALSPRGKLFCQQLTGATPEKASQALSAAGYTVHFSHLNDPLVAHQSYALHMLGYSNAVPTGGRVVSAVWDDPRLPFAKPRDVFLKVLQPTNAHYKAALWSGYPTAQVGHPNYSGCSGR